MVTAGVMVVIGIIALLAGCSNVRFGGGRGGPDPDEVPTYSAAEIDAINARMACRNAARTQVEIARCETR